MGICWTSHRWDAQQHQSESKQSLRHLHYSFYEFSRLTNTDTKGLVIEGEISLYDIWWGRTVNWRMNHWSWSIWPRIALTRSWDEKATSERVFLQDWKASTTSLCCCKECRRTEASRSRPISREIWPSWTIKSARLRALWKSSKPRRVSGYRDLSPSSIPRMTNPFACSKRRTMQRYLTRAGRGYSQDRKKLSNG